MTILFNTGGLIVWVAVGTLALYTHNTILPYIYLLYAVAMYVGNRYFACTTCYYYGKRCNLLGGLCAPWFFKKREGKSNKAELFLIGFSWLILALFPAVFLVYYQSWYWLGGYALIVLLWNAQHKYTACAKCKNEICPLNPGKQ